MNNNNNNNCKSQNITKSLNTMGAGCQTLQIGVQACNLVEVILGPKWMNLDMSPKNRQLRGGPGAFFDRKMNIFFSKNMKTPF